MGRRPPAIFVGDALGLDFLNSIATPVDVAIDWIEDGEGLASWLDQAKLLPADAFASIRACALPGELDKVAGQARVLREWFRGFVRSHMGRPLTAEDLAQLEPLNHLLERDESFSRIVPGPAGGYRLLELETIRRWRTPESLLAPDRGSAGAARLHRRLLERKGLRGPGLHAHVRRPHARARATLVQHGVMREPGEAGRSPASARRHDNIR